MAGDADVNGGCDGGAGNGGGEGDGDGDGDGACPCLFPYPRPGGRIGETGPRGLAGPSQTPNRLVLVA